jgi:hypothetical protein
MINVVENCMCCPQGVDYKHILLLCLETSIYAFLIPHCEFIQKIWNRYAGKARGPIGTGVIWVEYQAEFKAPLEGKLTQ